MNQRRQNVAAVVKSRLARAAIVFLLLYVATTVFHAVKPLPRGLNSASPWRAAAEVEFLADLTWETGQGKRISEQEIFDSAFAMLGSGDRAISADLFLINDFAAGDAGAYRALSSQTANVFIQQETRVADVDSLLISDPFNTLYGGLESALFQRLARHDTEVVLTDLRQLRDSNPIWSSAWRICCQWFGNDADGGWLPNPVGEQPVTVRSYLQLLNFKANHRKTFVVHGSGHPQALVTSANPHDASSRHGNSALRFAGPAAMDLLHAEAAVARFSGHAIALPDSVPAPASLPDRPRMRILTEARIRGAALATIRAAGAGDRIDLAMFYLSHRELISALIAAQQRNVRVRVLIDPNEHAFGRTKNGVPNRQVAWELHKHEVPVRWCDTSGEQCHSKMLLARRRDGTATLLLGSANYTRRNLDNFNLELDAQLEAYADSDGIAGAIRFFERRWTNLRDERHSLPYRAYADHSRWRYWQYRLMEFSGMSTF